MLNAAPTKEQVTVKRRFGLIVVDKRCCVERKDELFIRLTPGVFLPAAIINLINTQNLASRTSPSSPLPRGCCAQARPRGEVRKWPV